MDSYQEGFKAGASASLVKSTIDVVLIHANLEHLIKDNYPPGNLRKRFREQIRYVCRQSKNYRPFMGFGSEKLNINFKKLTSRCHIDCLFSALFDKQRLAACRQSTSAA